MVQWWEGRTTSLQKAKQYRRGLFSFQMVAYSILSVIQSVFATHSLRLLLTQCAAFSLYTLDPNELGILMTSNANIFIHPLYNTEVF